MRIGGLKIDEMIAPLPGGVVTGVGDTKGDTDAITITTGIVGLELGGEETETLGENTEGVVTEIGVTEDEELGVVTTTITVGEIGDEMLVLGVVEELLEIKVTGQPSIGIKFVTQSISLLHEVSVKTHVSMLTEVLGDAVVLGVVEFDVIVIPQPGIEAKAVTQSTWSS